ncbi:MAG: hypothetical protein M1826_003384 [Phylliscum demangeonii]|nr:MAG: hypothetical protein M1826_003384 [Phylliscum demangeonii]
MAPLPTIVTSTLQAALLSATSNLLAQLLTLYQTHSRATSGAAPPRRRIDPAPIVQFVVFTLVSCPPNILWQEWLELALPGRRVGTAGVGVGVGVGKQLVVGQRSSSSAAGLHVGNTLAKVVLDQTLGAAVNTLAFVAFMAALQAGGGMGKGTVVAAAVRKDFWPIMRAGWRLWPLVSLLNFTLVPVHRRVLVASAVGVGWGVYLSLVAARRTRQDAVAVRRDETDEIRRDKA